jgi:hypothetical protein
MRWRAESAVNAAVDLFIYSGVDWWAQLRVSSPISVSEGGETSTWQAMAIESRMEGIDPPAPCRPDRFVSLYLWKPLPDSSGIDAIFFSNQVPRLSDDDDAFGHWRGCPFRMGLGRGPVLRRATLRGKDRSDFWAATKGEAHVETIGLGAVGAPCRLPSGALFDSRCEEISIGTTIRAVIEPTAPGAGAPRDLVIGPAAVAGIRRFGDCNDINQVCRDVELGLLVRQEMKRHSDPWFGESDRFTAPWRGDTVLRTTVQVRFKPTATRAEIEATLIRWWARIEIAELGEDYLVTLPDPGPKVGAFERMIARLEREPSVEAVYPWRARRWAPLAPPGRVAFTLTRSSGEPLSAAIVCQAVPWDPGIVVTPRCGTTDRAGRATIDSLPPWSLVFRAGCPGKEREWIAVDSTVVRVEPAQTVAGHFQPVVCSDASR